MSKHLHCLSLCLCNTLYVHGTIYQETSLLTAGGKDIKNFQEILNLLQTIWLPSKVTVTHCSGHQKNEYIEAQGNQAANLATKQAAGAGQSPSAHVLVAPLLKPLKYSEKEFLWAKVEEPTEGDGWQVLPGGKVFLPDT